MLVRNLSDIETPFEQRIIQMVWCNLASLDPQDRLRSRIVQPIWEGMRGWIATRRHSPKEQHLAHHPFVSLAYIGDNIRPLYIDATLVWNDDSATKQAVWERSRSAPEPLRFDFTPMYQSPENPNFGVLEIRPWRIELADMFGESQIWYDPGIVNDVRNDVA